jgi:hypothetical protein
MSRLEELCKVYAEKSDTELLALNDGFGDLTETAQQALTQVMQERGLEAAGGESAEVVAERSEGALTAEEVCIYTFNDALSAKEALRILDEAGVDVRAVDWNELDPQESQNMPLMRIGVVVFRDQEREARKVLHDGMGLFPQAEVDDPFAQLGSLMMVGFFERADALIAARALGEKGISYVWKDDRDDETATTDEVTIEVKGTRLDEAQAVVEKALGE